MVEQFVRLLYRTFDIRPIRHELHSFDIAVGLDDVDLESLIMSFEYLVWVFVQNSNNMQHEWQNMDGGKCLMQYMPSPSPIACALMITARIFSTLRTRCDLIRKCALGQLPSVGVTIPNGAASNHVASMRQVTLTSSECFQILDNVILPRLTLLFRKDITPLSDLLQELQRIRDLVDAAQFLP